MKKREPLALRAAIVAMVDALVHLVVVFGVDLTGEQTAAVSGFVNLASLVVVAVWARRKVTPVDDPALEASETYAARHAG